MRFFIPHAEDEAQAERVLSSIAKFVSAPIPSLKRRIRKITWKHNGTRYSGEVGAPVATYFGGEEVIAILHNGNCYCVCTPNRGVLRGEPIYAGDGDETSVVYFSEDTAASA